MAAFDGQRFAFRGAPKDFTVGYEAELWLVRLRLQEHEPGSRLYDLVPRIHDVLAAVRGTEHEPHVVPETLKSQVEVITGVDGHDTVAEAGGHLHETIRFVRGALEPAGVGLAGGSTHPWADPRCQEVTDRHPRFGELARVYEEATRNLVINGFHIHVGVSDLRHATWVMRAMLYLEPLLTAITASSPFWMGRYTGYHSWRTQVYQTLPLTGTTPQDTVEDYARAHDDLIEGGQIATNKEIHLRVRPTAHTVEARFAEVPLMPMEFDAAGALIQATAAAACFEGRTPLWAQRPLPYHLRAQNAWLASRFGLGTVFCAGYDEGGMKMYMSGEEWLAEVIREVSPFATQLRCDEELAAIRTIVGWGTPAERLLSLYCDRAGVPQCPRGQDLDPLILRRLMAAEIAETDHEPMATLQGARQVQTLQSLQPELMKRAGRPS